MIVPALIIVIWVVASLLTNLNAMFLPRPLGIGHALVEEMLSGQLPFHFSVSLVRVGLGIALAALIGIPLGLLMSQVRWLRDSLLPTIEFIRGIPTSMLFPLFIVFFGVGEASKVMIGLYLSVPILIVSTLVGAEPRRETQGRRDYIALHRDRIPPIHRLLAILWDASPSIAAGLKVALSLALVIVIVTEMFFVSDAGIGWVAFRAYQSFQIDRMYVYIVCVGTLSYLLNSLIDRLILLLRSSVGDT